MLHLASRHRRATARPVPAGGTGDRGIPRWGARGGAPDPDGRQTVGNVTYCRRMLKYLLHYVTIGRMDTASNIDLALKVARERGIARARDFTAAGVPLVYLQRLCRDGRLVRLARGLYQLPEFEGASSAHNLAEAARLAPQGVVSLLSALRHHGLTTQLPHAVWLTLPYKARIPKAAPFQLEIVRAAGPALTKGIEQSNIEGVSVPIYGVAKTLADCFKHRRRVGLDVAMDALREALQKRKTSPAEIWECATANRVANVMRPYIEALS